MLALLFALFAYEVYAATSTAVSPVVIGGSILQPFADSPSALTIAVYGRNGVLASSAPVTRVGSFSLYSISPGDYVVHIIGAVEQEYEDIFIHAGEGGLEYVEVRDDLLRIPGRNMSTSAGSTIDAEYGIVFRPKRKARFKREKKKWTLRSLLRYKYRLLQLLGAAFVVWFPQFMRSLPKDIREELMGEKEDDGGDPNAVFKMLVSYEEKGANNGTETGSAAQRGSR